MPEKNQAQKAGRVQVSFYLPDYVYENFIKRLGIEDADRKAKMNAVNAINKIFSLHFASGKAGLEFTLETKELKKVA